MLRLQAKSRLFAIGNPVLSPERTIQKVARIKLHGGLRGPDFHHAPAFWLAHLCRLLEFRPCFVDDEIVIVSVRQTNHLVVGIYPLANDRRFSEVQRRPRNGTYLPSRN